MAVRRSLKGDAARIAMRLGADTNIETLLHKLESAYGISIQDDLLMRVLRRSAENRRRCDHLVTGFQCLCQRLVAWLYGQRHPSVIV
jgi:hypothetical protein